MNNYGYLNCNANEYVHPLDERERDHMRTWSLIYRGSAFITSSVIAVGSLIALWRVIWGESGHLLLLLIPVAVWTVVFSLAYLVDRKLALDISGAKKIWLDTDIIRLQKVGLFDLGSGSLLSSMFGAIYYVWINDKTKSPPQRRLKILMGTYNNLMISGANKITISYLPRSGKVLSIDAPPYHYSVVPNISPE